MITAADQARLRFDLGGLSLCALSLEGEEALSGIFRFSIEVLAPPGFSLTDALARSGTLSFSGPGGRSRQVIGLVTGLRQVGRHTDGRPRVRIDLESHLARLRLGAQSRIVLSRTVPEIVAETLGRHGIGASRVRFHLCRTYPARPWTVQAQESDFDFLARLLARAGIFFRSVSEEGEEIFHFADHNGAFPALEGVIPFRPGGGLVCGSHGLSGFLPSVLPPEQAAFHELSRCGHLRPGEIGVHGVNAELPGIPLAAVARTGMQNSAARTHFATGAPGLEEADREARLRAERERVESDALIASGNLADLFPGAVITLAAASLGFGGEWIVERLTHRAAQHAGEGTAGDDHPYTCSARLIRREIPYRAAIPENPALALTFSARIESDQSIPRLDEQGRYRLRTLFDAGDAPHAQGSIPIRRLAPYAGPGGDYAAGWHTPLHDGAEVLLSCLNGDPDQPMIVGNLPNPATPSLVTADNPSQNLLRSAADSELLLDDAPQKEVIRLRTFGGHTLLALDAATLGHRLALESRQGTMQWQAKETMRLQSGDTLTETSGNDRLQQVENNHATMTNQGEIHHQSAADIVQQAGENLRLHADRNIEAQSGKRVRLEAARDARITVRGGRSIFTVQQGEVHIQAAREIRIKGQGGGDITVAQGGGGFSIAPDGAVTLFGNTVTLKGDSVTFNGPVSYDIGSPALPAIPEAAAPLAVGGIAALLPEGSPQIVDVHWSRARIPVGEEVEVCFTVKNFTGGEIAEIAVFETNADGSRRQIDRLQCALTDGFGPCRFSWKRPPEQVQEDLINDENVEDVQPLTYIFEVMVEETRSQTSPGLHLTGEIRLTPVDEEGRSLEDGTELHLIDAGGRRHSAKMDKGLVVFEEVCLGPCQLYLGQDSLLLSVEE